MQFIKTYQPQYYEKFTCTGTECKNNCCHHWGINIDKCAYDKYMNLDEESKKDFDENIAFFENDKDKPFFKLQPNGNCSFLNDEGLCRIQIKFGHDFLSETCRKYPRIACNVGGGPEYFLELSCEVAANLILFDKGYMNFIEIDVPSDVYYTTALNFNYVFNPEKYTKSTDGYTIFWKLRVTSMSILQNRNYTIRFRMLLLCMFIQEAADLFEARKDNDVITLSDIYLARFEQKYYDELASKMPQGIEREYNIILDVLKEMHDKFKTSRQMYNTAKEGLGIDADFWEIPEDFHETFNDSYNKHLAANEAIFENYLVHRVLSEAFPFNYKNKDNITTNFVDLLAKFNMVEFLVTGICNYYNGVDNNKIADCISIFTRGYEHSREKYLEIE